MYSSGSLDGRKGNIVLLITEDCISVIGCTGIGIGYCSTRVLKRDRERRKKGKEKGGSSQ
jgi:hypothetical protein